MRTNAPAAVNTERTYEGGLARTPKAADQLVRQVANTMLFENTYYESGEEIANGIAKSAAAVPVEAVAALAVRAREDFKLRHVPLFLLAQMDRRRAEIPGLVSSTVERVVQRPDEMAELLAIIQKVNPGKPLKKVISAQVKKGLARAFRKFSPYSLAKWNREREIKLRDVLFLVHPKPKTEEQSVLWKKLSKRELEAPDTWETALSAGKDKKTTWERLLRGESEAEAKLRNETNEPKREDSPRSLLGYIALLMNLRNMETVGVDRALVEKALLAGAKESRALPFRFVSAAKHAPSYAQTLSDAMLKAIESEEKLPGKTALVIDVSGSMDAPLSGRGTLLRWEAAAALGILLREVCESVRVFTFSTSLVEVSNYRGLPMLDGVARSQPHGGTNLAASLRQLYAMGDKLDRLIVITDEQAHDGIASPPNKECRNYLINVASYHPALSTGSRWVRISGFSERLVDWVRFEESPEESPEGA